MSLNTHRVACVLSLLLLASSAWAQSGATGGIAGVVKDTSGAMIPGVTVEAASPALIEKVRTAVTDDKGAYKIVELRPGTYTVTFTLTGFNSVRREGIELTTGFTAAVNAEMKVGALQETVVVTGASPIVDIQNVRTQTVLSREVMDTLPTGKTVNAFATLTLGVTGTSSPTFDVGGGAGEQFFGFGVHGSHAGDGRITQDGMMVNEGATGSRRNQVNPVAVEETTIQTRGMSAETEVGGPQINAVPRDGGNIFKLFFETSDSAPSLQASNLTDALRARNISVIGGIRHLYDVGVGVGGPIVKDKLWFYSSNRWWGEGRYNPGRFFNATQHTSFFYTPDLTQQAYNLYDLRDNGGRVTWQASSKDKFTGSVSDQSNCTCYKLSGGVDINRSPEASVNTFFQPVITQVTWSRPATNRLLFEAGLTDLYDKSRTTPTDVGLLPGDTAKQELNTGFWWGARLQAVGAGNDYGDPTLYKRAPFRVTASYITGSHAFKAGFTGRYLNNYLVTGPEAFGVPPYSLQLRGGAPSQITEWATPYVARNRGWEFGYFAQDQWTLKKLTVNAGVRIDTVDGTAIGGQVPAGMFRVAVNSPDVTNAPHWKDIDPRLGISYDLFGNGKTAIKASLGRYVALQDLEIAAAVNPANAIAQSATRTWTDSVANLVPGYVPNCVLTNPLLNNGCGQISNLSLGKPIIVTAYDPNYTSGWDKRGYNWQTTVSLQQQLTDHLGFTAGYYRTSFGNFTVTQNTAVVPTDYNSYCITLPADARLPGGGGNQVCGLYDVVKAQAGKVKNVIGLAQQFGDQTEVYNGFDISLTSRFGGGRLLQGGVSTGQIVTDNCYQNARPDLLAALAPGVAAGTTTPRTQAFCHVAQPWLAATQLKLAGIYPLPWGLQASGTLQNVATSPIEASQAIPNSQIAQSLTRNLSACPAATGACTQTVTIVFYPQNTQLGQRLTQLDLRLTEIIKAGRTRWQLMADLYNVFNTDAVINVNNTYGTSAWQTPLTILGARTAKFGLQLDW